MRLKNLLIKSGSVLCLTLGVCYATGEGDKDKPSVPIQRSKIWDAAEIAAIGVGRAVIGLPIEHPWDTMKTRWQAHPGTPSLWGVAQDVIAKKGYGGFYSGFIPNTIRAGTKQTYRYPMMILFPPLYEKLFPDSEGHNNKYVRKIATGLTIANAEVFIINPLERLKVWLMTKESKATLPEFFSKNSGKIGAELLRGTTATFPRQNISWVSFLWADEWCKTKMKDYTGRQDLTPTDLLLSGGVVGVINTAATLPFDSVKTHMQMFSAEEGLIKTAQKIAREHGLKGFYAGWQPRIVQYMIQAMLTVQVLDYLENKFGKK